MGLIPVPGEPIDQEQLAFARSAEFARFLQASEAGHFKIVGFWRLGASEGISIDVEAGVAQRPLNDIRFEEPILVIFSSEEDLPEVLSLRDDFPLVEHLNITYTEYPRSLCLFEEDVDDLNYRWTPGLLADRILWWLRSNADGKLHRDDQSAEQLIGGVLRPIILPPDLLGENPPELLNVFAVNAGLNRTVFIAERPEALAQAVVNQYSLFVFCSEPQGQMVIRREPQTLEAAQQIFAAIGLDLAEGLGKKLVENASSLVTAGSKGVILLTVIPRADAQGQIQRFESYGFLCGFGEPQMDLDPVQLAVKLGLFGEHKGNASRLIGAVLARSALKNISVTMLQPEFLLKPEFAAILSGNLERDDRRILAVGMGALGSHVIPIMCRNGFGTWTLVDEDFIRPHNLVRYGLSGFLAGFPKATVVAHQMNCIFSGAPIAEAIVTNILRLGSDQERLNQRAGEAAWILDLSASLAASRHLCLSIPGNARRFSAFLSPDGLDLVILAEDADRLHKLDALEMQYLRHVMRLAELDGHLQSGIELYRYGRGCRDLTSRIPEERIAQHSATIAAFLKQATHDLTASAAVWRLEANGLRTRQVQIPLAKTSEVSDSGWTVVFDDQLTAELLAERKLKLPNETCGVLLGNVDTKRKRIYVVDFLEAPSDSIETPGGCSRGVHGLTEVIHSILERTLGQVEYVGEWHSHPDGALCLPSEDDQVQMDWIRKRMHSEGKPGVILIACEKDQVTLYLSLPEGSANR